MIRDPEGWLPVSRLPVSWCHGSNALSKSSQACGRPARTLLSLGWRSLRPPTGLAEAGGCRSSRCSAQQPLAETGLSVWCGVPLPGTFGFAGVDSLLYPCKYLSAVFVRSSGYAGRVAHRWVPAHVTVSRLLVLDCFLRLDYPRHPLQLLERGIHHPHL